MKYKHTFLILFSVLYFFFPMGCVIYPELAKTGQKAPKSEKCGECHRDIYNEWEKSPHARSYINPIFREETNEYRFRFCLGCHIPETIFTDQKIVPRNVHLEEGINCNGCHLNNDCALAGPTPAHGPHPIEKKNPFYRKSKLCGKCHIGTFQAWQAAVMPKEKKTCQDCHMPRVQRKLIQDEPWQRIYPVRNGKKHVFTFQNLSDEDSKYLSLAFTQMILSEDKIEGVLELKNTGIPHSVPTGDYGYREVLVRIELFDETGKILDFRTKSLFVELKTALRYQEKREINFTFPVKDDSYTIRAALNRVSFDRKENHLLAERFYEL